jgi:hypothetical protein
MLTVTAAVQMKPGAKGRPAGTPPPGSLFAQRHACTSGVATTRCALELQLFGSFLITHLLRCRAIAGVISYPTVSPPSIAVCVQECTAS